MEEIKFTPGNPAQPAPPELLHREWFQLVVGMLPFVLFGLGMTLTLAPLRFMPMVGAGMALAGLLSVFVGLLVGWLGGFPRWTPPYVVLAILIPFYLMHAATPGLVIFNRPLFGGDMWGWRAWVLPGAIALAALVLSRPPWGNLVRLVRGIWQDWTRLSFGLYAILVFLPLIGLDEIEHGFRLLPSLLATLIIVLGAFLYLRWVDWRAQALALLGCASLAILIVATNSQVYWQTHDVNFTTGVRTFVDRPLDYFKLVEEILSSGSLILPLLIAPGLIGLMRRVLGVVKQPEANAGA